MDKDTLGAISQIAENITKQTRLIEGFLQGIGAASGYPQGQGMGQLVPAPGVEVTEDWIEIPFNYPILAAGVPGALSIQSYTIGGSGHFDLVKITFVAGAANDFEMRIQSGDSDKYLSAGGAYIRINNTAGTAQLPYYILGKRRFSAREVITIEIRDVSGAGNTNIQIVLHGIRVYV